MQQEKVMEDIMSFGPAVILDSDDLVGIIPKCCWG